MPKVNGTSDHVHVKINKGVATKKIRPYTYAFFSKSFLNNNKETPIKIILTIFDARKTEIPETLATKYIKMGYPTGHTVKNDRSLPGI